MTNESEKWVARVTGGDSERQAALRAGIVQATLSRQLRNNLLTPENVVAIARAYKASVLDGLVAIGLIQAADVVTMSARDALLAATDEDLVGEVLRRIQAGSASGALTEPAGTVHEFRGPRASSETWDEEAATFSERAVANEDETLEEEGIAQLEDP